MSRTSRETLMNTLGLDIGSNSVGSAWVDVEKGEIHLGVSVFPAGVDETEEGRGAPKNQERREKRSLRRSLRRRSQRKRLLRQRLIQAGLFPSDPYEVMQILTADAWELRRRGLYEELTPFEFGRVLVHLCQRRGALGLHIPLAEDALEDAKEKKKVDEDAKVKAAVERTREAMREYDAQTFGELIAMVAQKSRRPVLAPVLDDRRLPKTNERGEEIMYCEPVRNRLDSFQFHAERVMIRDEFRRLWDKQRSFDGSLARLLTKDLCKGLDDPSEDHTWRHRGLLFGQRRTYWNVGTLGRCELEPTDRCVPIADRHASYFRVLETANNIRIRGPGDRDFRPLNQEEHAAVMARLREKKAGSVAGVRAALQIDKRSLKKRDLPDTTYALNLERDEDREINTDWFYREVVLGAITLAVWEGWSESTREGLNRALLRFDPQLDDDANRLSALVVRLGLDQTAANNVVTAWRARPKLEKRLNMSRRAILKLIPLMEENPKEGGPRRTQIDARLELAKRMQATDLDQSEHANCDRGRYALGTSRLSKADRYFLRRHPDLLPPAPTMTNPVVRKAIHEVRRHLVAHIRRAGRKPDRVVIEFARETNKTKKVSDRILFQNRNRERTRKRIIEEIIKPELGARFHSLSTNQLRSAVDRVVLCFQQRQVCAYSLKQLGGQSAYSARPITPFQAARGVEVEIDHIIPYSRSGDNSLNNRVLCYRDSNRDKGRLTPREWWGDRFDERIAPLRFMDGYRTDKDDYFSVRDYAAKWRRLTQESVSDDCDWKGSQLSDTAYAAREVQNYLQYALWPNEPSHLAGGQRRIFVTKGAYTSTLRRDWRLYQRLRSDAGPAQSEDRPSGKNRGDHREHAIDAVAIALTDPERIIELARRVKEEEEKRYASVGRGDSGRIKRDALSPPHPWTDLKFFRRAVLTQVYDSFDPLEPEDAADAARRIVVSHRASGRKLTGRLHEDTLFGPVPGDGTLFTSHKRTSDLTPKHLRLPRRETAAGAIARLAERFLRRGLEGDIRNARKRAKAIVEKPGFTPRQVDPAPEKSGIVRDASLRAVLREEINRRLSAAGIPRDADSFTKGDLNRILDKGKSLPMKSGVPIKRVVLLRTMNDPVRIPKKQFDYQTGEWGRDDAPRAGRAYVGGNNHHIEIREDASKAWSGQIVMTYDATHRVRMKRLPAVDRSDDPKRGGRFIMSLSVGETLYMRHKTTGKPDFFVVFKLDKPQTVQLKHHWDARRATGEKDDQGGVVPNSEREEMAVTASQLRDLAPPGHTTTIKIAVDPLGRWRQIEPLAPMASDLSTLDPRVVEIAKEAISLRGDRSTANYTIPRTRQPGSWSWMRARLRSARIEHLVGQLSAALRTLTPTSNS